MNVVYIIVYLAIIVVMIGVGFFSIRARTSGKIVVFLIDKDKTMKNYLFRPQGKLFKFKKDEEAYIINPDSVVLIRYPFGMPKIIQQIVPCLVYAKGNPEALQPGDKSFIMPKGQTSSMVNSVVSENIVKGIIKGVEAENKKALPAWFLPAVGVFLQIVSLYFLYQMSKGMNVLLEGMKKMIGGG